jgi:hypothetical protein
MDMFQYVSICFNEGMAMIWNSLTMFNSQTEQVQKKHHSCLGLDVIFLSFRYLFGVAIGAVWFWDGPRRSWKSTPIPVWKTIRSPSQFLCS